MACPAGTHEVPVCSPQENALMGLPLPIENPREPSGIFGWSLPGAAAGPAVINSMSDSACNLHDTCDNTPEDMLHWSTT